MPMYAKTALLLLLMATLASCEEVLVATDLPYVEKLVIEGLLVPGIPDTLQIGHTLPTTRAVDESEYMVTDAEGEIVSGSDSYPLRSFGDGRYIAEGLVPETGRSYTIAVRWKSLTANATTFVPLPEQLDTAYFLDNYYIAELTPRRPGAFRSFSEARYTGGETYRSAGYDVYANAQANASGKLLLLDYIRFSNDPSLKRWIGLYTYDPAFYDYDKSRHNNGDVFGGSDSPRRWNVTGDGIGIFIGRSESIIRVD